MKTRLSIYALFLSLAAVVSLTSCSKNKEGHADHSGDHAGHDSTQHASGSTAQAEASEPQFKVDENFQNQLASVFTSYVELKDAFVESDANKVKDEAKETEVALAKVDMKLLSGAAHNDWMAYLSPLQNALKEIQSASDIEAQRNSFSDLSENLYKSVKAFGLGGKEAFYEYCPMAFNNQGAYWLSDTEKIRNPYFGNKMLTCGSVEEKLK